MNLLKKYSTILMILFFIFVQFNCQPIPEEEPQSDLSPDIYGEIYKITDFDIQNLAYTERPYYRTSPVSLENPALCDSLGIALHVRNNDTTYHPVVLAQYMIKYTTSYYLTQDMAYLEKADQYLNKLMEDAHYTADSIPFFPYTFDFELHGDYSQVMKAPWYSAMAQGQALTAIVDLYEFTNDEKYKKIADKVYQSFKLRTKTSKYWVTVADEHEYLWLEEYPMEQFNYTLNGTIFAIYGIYDYYRINHTDSVKNFLNGAITSIHDNVLRYRNVGSYSNYCLKHAVPSKEYHIIHIGELKQLYKMTNNEDFNEYAKLFTEDYYDY